MTTKSVRSKEDWEKTFYEMLKNLVVLNGWMFAEWKDKENYRDNWKQFVVFRDFIRTLLTSSYQQGWEKGVLDSKGVTIYGSVKDQIREDKKALKEGEKIYQKGYQQGRKEEREEIKEWAIRNNCWLFNRLAVDYKQLLSRLTHLSTPKEEHK
jgi:hypothetical protein